MPYLVNDKGTKISKE
jgi:glutamyl/glutaminyl-tRNA synthetase